MVMKFNSLNPQLKILFDEVDILSYAGVQLILPEITHTFLTDDPCIDYDTALMCWRKWVLERMVEVNAIWIPYYCSLKLQNIRFFCALSHGAYWMDDLELKFRGW